MSIKFKTTAIRGPERDFWAYGVNIAKPSHPDIERLVGAGYCPAFFAKKVWQSNFLLMDYCARLPVQKKLRVLEIGAGWGSLSVFFNKHFQASATACDLDTHVVPYQQLLADRNATKVHSETLAIEEITDQRLHAFDLIVASDICYDDKMQAALQDLIERILCRRDIVFLLADTGRKSFLKLSQNTQIYQQVTLTDCAIETPMDLQGYILAVNPVKDILC